MEGEFIKNSLKLCPECKKSEMKLDEGNNTNPFTYYLFCPNCCMVIGLRPAIDWEKILGFK